MLRKYVDVLTPIKEFDNIEEKFQNLYFEVIQTMIDEIKERFGEGNSTLCFFYSLFVENNETLSFNELKEKLFVYCGILDSKKTLL